MNPSLKQASKLCTFSACSVLLLLLGVSCHPAKNHPLARYTPIALSQESSISALLAAAEKESASGKGEVQFMITKDLLTLEFPLMDDYKIHWQFKALDEAQRLGEDDDGTCVTPTALVIRLTLVGNDWIIGKSPFSDKQACAFIRKAKTRGDRTVVVCVAEIGVPVAKITTIWMLAQELGYKFVLQPVP